MNTLNSKGVVDIALLHDGGPVSGISTHIYKIYQNLQFHQKDVGLYQYLQWKPTISLPNGTFIVNKSPPKNLYRSGILRKIDTVVNLFTGNNWRYFKNIRADVYILSNPSLVKLTNYLKNCIVIGHDLYYIHKNKDSKLLNLYFKKQYKLLRKVPYIISNSEFTKNEFISILGIEQDMISTVYPYFDKNVFHPGQSSIKSKFHFNKDDKIILSIGSDQPNKNIESIIKLMAKLPSNYKLLRIGKNGPTLKIIQELNLKNRVTMLEGINEIQLAEIYRGSDILVFPSLFEGFGSPVLEAMATGVPVLVSNRGSLPEVAGNAGIISDPFDIDFMANEVQKTLESESLTSSFIKKGLERANTFTMENQYKSISNVLEKFEPK